MGLLSDLFNRKQKARTVEGAEAALARLRDERRKAAAEVAGLAEQRRALLLVDDSDGEIERLEQASRAVERTLERLEEAEPKLLAELVEARDRRRQAQWKELRGRGLAAAEKFLASACAARTDLEAYAAVIDEAHARGFRSEAAHSFPFAPVSLSPELLAASDRAIERTSTVADQLPPPPAKARKPSPAPTTAAPAAPAKKTRAATPKAAPPSPPAPRREPPKADADGMIWVMTTRPGLQQPASGESLKMGATVRIPFDAGLAWLRIGCATQVDAPPAQTATPKGEAPSPPETQEAAQ